MQPILQDMLARRRDRSIAITLGVKERECDQHLPEKTSQKLRKVILDQFNDFHDISLDIIRSLDTGDYVLNEEFLVRIERKIDSIVRDLREDDDGN